MRALKSGMTALGLVAALAGSAAAQAPSGELTVMIYSGVFQDNYTQAVVDGFRRKFPGVNTTVFPQQNSALMLGTLRSQKGSPQVDVAIMDVSVQKVGNDEGLFAKLDPAQVPSLAELYDTAKVAGEFGPAVTFDHWVMIYNKDTVQPAPTGLADLWNPANRGQIVVPGVPDIVGIAMLILANKMEGGDYKQSIDAGMKKVRELSPMVQSWDPRPDPYTFVINGQAKFGGGWNARGQFYRDQSGGKLQPLLPKEGSVFQINTINLVAGSKNPAAAQAYINYALGAEAQAAFTEKMFYAPVNKTAKISPAALERTASSPEMLSKMVPVDWVFVSQVRDRWLDRWRREVIPAGR